MNPKVNLKKHYDHRNMRYPAMLNVKPKEYLIVKLTAITIAQNKHKRRDELDFKRNLTDFLLNENIVKNVLNSSHKHNAIRSSQLPSSPVKEREGFDTFDNRKRNSIQMIPDEAELNTSKIVFDNTELRSKSKENLVVS